MVKGRGEPDDGSADSREHARRSVSHLMIVAWDTALYDPDPLVALAATRVLEERRRQARNEWRADIKRHAKSAKDEHRQRH